MPRYINEDDFCEYIRKNTTPSGAEWFISKIKDMPAAEVVEVVRCEDCKYLKEIDDTANLYVCARIDIGMDGEPSFLSPENDFCSRGERRETDGEIHKCR